MAQIVRILNEQQKVFVAKPNPHLLLVVDETDCRIWYFMVVGLEIPFTHGEFIFRLTAPDTFPFKPPKFEFLTENGVFMPGGPICISVGELHANDAPGAEGAYGWRASLGIASMRTSRG